MCWGTRLCTQLLVIQNLIKFCAGISRPWVESPPRRTPPSSSLFQWVRQTLTNCIYLHHRHHHHYFLHWASSHGWDRPKKNWISFTINIIIIFFTDPLQWWVRPWQTQFLASLSSCLYISSLDPPNRKDFPIFANEFPFFFPKFLISFQSFWATWPTKEDLHRTAFCSYGTKKDF